MVHCDRCEEEVPGHRAVSVVDRGDLCLPCFNEETAERLGIAFDNTRLEPITVLDTDGSPHTFEICSWLGPTGHSMQAIEIRDGEARGYELAVLGDVEADAMDLFGHLYRRVREELATRHVRKGPHGWQITEDDTLRGRIEADLESDTRLPLLVVDGEELTWEEVGRMLMTYEGFHFDLRIRNRSEIVQTPS